MFNIGDRVRVHRITGTGSWSTDDPERFIGMGGTVRRVFPDATMRYAVDMDNGERNIRFTEDELTMTQDIHSIIERLKELHGKAISAPWREGTMNVWQDDICLCIASTLTHGMLPRKVEQNNAALIAEMRNALPALLEYILQLEGALKPFSVMGEHYVGPDEKEYHGLIHSGGSVTRLTYGDLRRARHVLNRGE